MYRPAQMVASGVSTGRMRSLDGQIIRLRPVPNGRLKQLSVGNPKNIWGVNAKNQIFTWTGNGWRQIAGELKYVSASADGAVWGVNSKDEVFRWTGNSFTPVPNGSLKQISVGNSSGGHPVRSRVN